jgi:hypothetical protein
VNRESETNDLTIHRNEAPLTLSSLLTKSPSQLAYPSIMNSEPPPIPMPPVRHSGIGIASFILSIFAALGIFALFCAAGIIQSTTPGGMDQRSPTAIILGLCIIGMLALDLIAAGLGIGGVLQKERKKLFAVLGIIFSLTAIVCAVLLMAVGLAMKQS